MKKPFLTLDSIWNDHEITMDTDPEFLLELQQGMLLALKEWEILNELQYRQAQEALVRKHQTLMARNP